MRKLTQSIGAEYFVFQSAVQKVKIEIYKTVILPVVLYGSVTLRRKPRLGVFENRVLRKIFGPKKYEITGEWRRLHNEQLHTLLFGDQVKKNEMGGKCGRYGRQER
jgi:hypothetical protein